MSIKLKFIENEVKTNELFAEFYLEQNTVKDGTENIIGIILIDNQTNELKEHHITKEFFDKDEEFLDSIDFSDEFTTDTKVLINLLIEKVKGEDLNRNWYSHH